MVKLSRMQDGDVLVTCSVSGGKDSAATALYLRELGVSYRAVFADTGWESDETYRYIDEILQPAIGPIETVRADIQVQPERMALVEEVEAILGISPSPMVRACVREAAFPSHAAKFCTRMLKVTPIREWHHRMMARDARAIVSCVGIRASESEARSHYPEWEIDAGTDAIRWSPILSWAEHEVVDICRRHGLPPNPMYLRGAPRVGCNPCIHARKSQFALLDERRVAAIRTLEAGLLELAVAAGRGPGTTYTNRHGCEVVRRAPTWAAGDGRTPTALPRNPPIDVVMAWAEGAVGDIGAWASDRADGLDDDDQASEGCARWGLCERPGAQLTIWSTDRR